MTRDEIRDAIYESVKAFVAMEPSQYPTVEKFAKSVIGKTLSADGELEGWPGFRLKALNVAIQRRFQDHHRYINNFQLGWLLEHDEKPWQALIDHASRRIRIVS